MEDTFRALRIHDDEIPPFPQPLVYVPKPLGELFRIFDPRDAPLIGPPPVSHTWAARPKAVRPRATMSSVKNSKPYDEEDAEIQLLYAQARKYGEFVKKLEAARERINAIGASIEATAGPVNGLEIYRETQALRATNQNVNRVLEQLSIVQRPLEGKADEERIIQDGPERVGLTKYLASIRRLDSKCEELSTSTARVNQEAAEQLNLLAISGKNRLLAMWGDLLQADKLEPLQYITKGGSFPTFDRNTIAQLVEIYNFFSTSAALGGPSIDQAWSKYAKIRGAYLQSTLTNLSAATLSTSTQPSPNGPELYRQGNCLIGTYAEGMNLAFFAEWRNISEISPKNHQKTMENTAAESLMELKDTISQLNSQIQQNITTDCFLAYDILGAINEMAFSIDKQTGCLKQQIFAAVKPIRDTAKRSLGDLLEDIRRRISSMVFLPNDGAAIPFTDEVLTRLQAMTLYPLPLASILSSIGDGNWTSSSSNKSSSSLPTIRSHDTSSDSESLLARYVFDSIDNLLTNLESRSTTLHKNSRVTGVFMLNNIAVIDRMIRSSDLSQLLGNSSAMKQLEDKRKKYIAAYTEAWREAGFLLLDVQYTNRGQRPPSGSAASTNSAAIVKALNSKDKDAIKEKFKNFNVLFETLGAKHRELMPAMERDVRADLVRDIRAIIEPLYVRFWDRYHEVDKGKGKYIRYDKPSMSNQLASLA
ncbi:MAG: hypothetical protein GOMPHAMPRED_001153 [Gomphillus americanus]|uniref:Exocyst complex protein EXO70 n=1 Tax=Gomphillus americanus TaxID=1940652 RepID=A0A8H3F2D0_9LECA|nr:MAG: hypothetical protein GOMPHAMPRED_001153 [Gomphillus americanus]